MRILHLVPGSGGTFYCQNCMRDRELVVKLREMGHDVVMAPMYLPVFSEGEDIASDVPVFYGAEGPGPLYRRGHLLDAGPAATAAAPARAPLCEDDGSLDFWAGL